MDKMLVIFFSRAGENYVNGKIKYLKLGNTEYIAEQIVKLTGADSFRIERKVPYPADYCRCIDFAKREQIEGIRPKLLVMPEGLEKYNVIFLGYPVYWNTMPMPLYTFLENADLSNKHIFPFCTYECEGAGNSIADLWRLCAASVIGQELVIKGSYVKYEISTIKNWVSNCVSVQKISKVV